MTTARKIVNIDQIANGRTTFTHAWWYDSTTSTHIQQFLSEHPDANAVISNAVDRSRLAIGIATNEGQVYQFLIFEIDVVVTCKYGYITNADKSLKYIFDTVLKMCPKTESKPDLVIPKTSMVHGLEFLTDRVKQI
jgi:hypothetical protein